MHWSVSLLWLAVFVWLPFSRYLHLSRKFPFFLVYWNVWLIVLNNSSLMIFHFFFFLFQLIFWSLSLEFFFFLFEVKSWCSNLMCCFAFNCFLLFHFTASFSSILLFSSFFSQLVLLFIFHQNCLTTICYQMLRWINQFVFAS